MTVEIILGLIWFGLLDALNPATIATMMMLLPIVKKKWHALIFILGTYIVYLIIGLSIFFGGGKLLKRYIVDLVNRFPYFIVIIEFVISSVMLIFGFIYTVKLIKRIINKDVGQKDYIGIVTKFVTPLSLIMLAVTATLSDVTTSIPYFGFIGMLSIENISIGSTLILFIFYCFIYVSPMILLYGLYSFIHGEKFTKIELSFRNFINKATEYSIPIMLIVLGLFILIDALGRIIV